MFAKIFLLLFFCVLSGCVESVSYDQSQQGDLNVQVDLKGLNIIALMKGGKEEYVDYDYAYDYSEMTIKPHNGTTQKPLNFTNTATNSPLNAENDTTTAATTVFVEPTTVTSLNASNLSIETSTTSILGYTNSVNDTANSTSSFHLANNGTFTNSTSNNRCKKGFALNEKGDCELILQGTGNALLKLVKLSQRLKLRREKRRTTARG